MAQETIFITAKAGRTESESSRLAKAKVELEEPRRYRGDQREKETRLRKSWLAATDKARAKIFLFPDGVVVGFHHIKTGNNDKDV